MCDPITIGLGALSAGAALFGSSNKPEAAPAAAAPVIQPLAATRDPNADVKLGDGVKKKDETTSPTYEGFTEKRVTGTALGGLGRGGLGL